MNTSPEKMLISGKRYSIVSSLKALETARSQSYQPRIELDPPMQNASYGGASPMIAPPLICTPMACGQSACSPGLGRQPLWIFSQSTGKNWV